MSKTIFEHYKNYVSSVETTELYTEFSFYSLIAGCLQRRVWVKSEAGIFPNLYLIFVGDPGTGKTNAGKINNKIYSKLLKPDPEMPGALKCAINLAPDSVTVEQLIKKLSAFTDAFQDDLGNWHGHASMSFVSEELGTLIKKNDDNLVRFFIQAYDGSDYTRETIMHGIQKIKKPCVNFLASTIPGWMSNALSHSLLDDGFVGRAIFIWGGPIKIPITYYQATLEQEDSFKAVIEHCKYLTTVKGEVKINPEAREFFDNWYKTNRYNVINTDKKLVHYYARKKVNATKIAICNYFSRWPTTKELTIEDYQVALDTLKRAEMDMHLAFASTGTNPIYKLSTSILQFLQRTKKPFTWEQLRKLFFDECSNTGTTTDVNNAIEYLMLCNKVTMKPNEKNEVTIEAVRDIP